MRQEAQAGQFGRAGAQSRAKAPDCVGLGFFFAVFEVGNRFSPQPGEFSELTDAESIPLANLAETTKKHATPPH
jgi:hypothetical protein